MTVAIVRSSPDFCTIPLFARQPDGQSRGILIQKLLFWRKPAAIMKLSGVATHPNLFPWISLQI
jgi:hypothetical protein